MYARVVFVTAVLAGAVVGWAVLDAPEPAPKENAPVIVGHYLDGSAVPHGLSVSLYADFIYERASYSWCQQRSGFFSPARPDIAFTTTDESTTKCYVKSTETCPICVSASVATTGFGSVLRRPNGEPPDWRTSAYAA